MDDYELLHVGDIKPQWKSGGTLIRMEYDGVWKLYIGFPDMTKTEINELQTGDIRATFTVLDDSLFLLFKIGAFDWFDMPFEPRLNQTEFPPFQDGTGMALVLHIVDTATGKLLGLRIVGMGSRFSNLLHDVCRNMKGRITPEENARRVHEIYAKYPNSLDILKTADAGNMFLYLKNGIQ